MSDPTPLVDMRNIHVSYGGVHAVEDVSIDLYPGEVLALVGGNGAGKSTLIKTLSGAVVPDSGEIHINGERVEITNPRDAKQYGIETIYQTLALAENRLPPGTLGRVDDRFRIPRRWGRRPEGDEAPGRFENFKIPVARLSGGQRSPGGASAPAS